MLRNAASMPFPQLPAPLAAALAERGYAEPTAVQAAVLDPGTAGRDLLVSAQTGSGKTVAYGLALAASCSARRSGCRPPGALWPSSWRRRASWRFR
jgi:ATP-dependent RNA helicase DeaD